MKNKKTFEEAVIELVRFNAADIICSSGCTGYGGGSGNDTQDLPI